MDLKLKNKRVFVTGSTRGIGFAIASSFAAEGANVALCGRNPDALETAKGKIGAGSHLFLSSDITVPANIEKLREDINEAWSGLDILICNVGSGASVPDPVPDAANFARVMTLNFESAVNTARAFLPEILKSKGAIIFISSIAGVEAIKAPTDYSVAKTALIAFAKSLARKIGSSGARVNCIAPGNIFFPGGSWDKKLKQDPDGVRQMLEKDVPQQRFGTPEEIAHACLFLASDCATFITGSTLVIDGGQTAHII